MASGPRSSPILQQEMADRAANTGARRTMEEYETARSKLADQHFSMTTLVNEFLANYPDPFVPREKDSKACPPGVTPEMDQRWRQMIQQSKQ
ncbi:hypothetical protein FZEAL_1091 [Fusarium zealandicum]|uniref:Uncharacterized protein n=1 Tax=Fusarium zealandicum TaxID=1053134 RepID=A0A8H4UTE9_9HYPO|nr:hypothetical protein FZEAL_1091 [Fusarium zealandicum]